MMVLCAGPGNPPLAGHASRRGVAAFKPPFRPCEPPREHIVEGVWRLTPRICTLLARRQRLQIRISVDPAPDRHLEGF